MRKLIALALCAGLASFITVSAVEPDVKAEERRAKIDSVARETLDRLRAEAPHTKSLLEKAYGYAVFSNVKIALVFSGGGGSGVAVARESGERAYMRMGTAGVGVGVGGRKYQVVFLFEDRETFDRFVTKGWQADTSANATAGTAGAGVASTFDNGLAIFQFSEKGLMAQAEVAGTKYWKASKLN